ncbi:MAG TPA: 4Fe-4S dicluster domain-containing protein [Neobacillus sp.]
MGLLSKWVESLDYKYEILPSCTRYVSPHSSCGKCVHSCDLKAVELVNGKPVIDDEKCTECGKCISACPVQAIAGIYPKRTIIQNELVIKNQKIPTVKELLIFYKKGITTIVGETRSIIELWKDPIDEANALLKQLNEEPFSMLVKFTEEDKYYSRRALFSLWKNESKSAVKQAAPAKWRFNQDDFHLPKYYRDYQFARITINIEKCILCTACQKLCKNDCFTIGEEHFSLLSQGCSSCRLCVDACPEKAIIVEDQISNAKETLLPLYEMVCTVCHKTYKTLREHDEKCVACRKRESFQSLITKS